MPSSLWRKLAAAADLAKRAGTALLDRMSRVFTAGFSPATLDCGCGGAPPTGFHQRLVSSPPHSGTSIGRGCQAARRAQAGA